VESSGNGTSAPFWRELLDAKLRVVEPWTTGVTPPPERVLTRARARGVVAAEIVSAPALPLWGLLLLKVLRADIPLAIAGLAIIGAGLSSAAMGLGPRLAKGYIAGGVLRSAALRRLAEAGGLPVRLVQCVVYVLHAAGLGATIALLVRYFVDGPGQPG